MKKENKNKLKKMLKGKLGREPKANEAINMETDALLLAQFLITKVEELEDRIKSLKAK